MTAQILDGKAAATAIKAELAVRVAGLAGRGIVPGLGTVLVGDDPGSRAYVNGKHRDCAEVGIASIRRELPADASQQQVEAVVDELNADPACTGYIVQLPLPAGIDANAILSRIDPDKDADGLHPLNLGRLVLGQPGPLPCTPRGIVELLRRYEVPIAGAEVTIIGRGITVGPGAGPAADPAQRERHGHPVPHRDQGPGLAHPDGRHRGGRGRRPGLVTADMVRPGAAVLDVGITRTEAGLVGDVAPEVREVAGYLAPMPGGVGPMTRAMLLANVVDEAEAG